MSLSSLHHRHRLFLDPVMFLSLSVSFFFWIEASHFGFCFLLVGGLGRWQRRRWFCCGYGSSNSVLDLCWGFGCEFFS
jgi:hypothetical protein